MMTKYLLSAGLFLALTLVAFPTPSTDVPAPLPSLQFASTTGYQQSVAGKGWPAKRRVTRAFVQGSRVYGLELKTTSGGEFVIGVNNFDPCNGDLYIGRDEAEQRARVQGAGLGCPVSQNPPTPVLTVLRGNLLNITVTHVDLPAKGSVKMIEGNAVYVWEAGNTNAMWLPAAPRSYFSLIGKGRTPPRACPEVECAAGYFWEWVAMKAGMTGISVNPHCRPRCEIPSYEIPVTIKTRPIGGMPLPISSSGWRQRSAP